MTTRPTDPNRDYLRFLERQRQWDARAAVVAKIREAGGHEDALPEVDFDGRSSRYRGRIRRLPQIRRQG